MVCLQVAGGTIKSRRDEVDYLTWTYFYRRLMMNPSYYGLEEVSPEAVSDFLYQHIDVSCE